MKFLYITDLHLRTQKPINRTDEDYFSEQFKKLTQIFTYVKSNKIKYLFIGGDIFDVASSSYKLFVATLSFFMELSKFCEIYTICGNHDILGGSKDTIDRVALGGLLASGAVKKLETLSIDNVHIRGLDYRLIPDKSDYMTQSKKDKKIIISHDMIVPHNDFPFDVFCVEDIETNYDLVLCSHYHIPFEKKKGKTLFLNPGSLMRLKLVEDNVNRLPQMLLVEILKTKIKYEFIQLKALPGKVIFDVQGKREFLEEEMKLEEFFTSLSSLNNALKQFDVEEALGKLKRDKSVSDDVYKEALSRIQVAKTFIE